MFDVGFGEMVVIAVVALIVIGPERLPRVARTLGHLYGRMQRYVNNVKADISREIELDELRKFRDQFKDAAQSAENSIRDEAQRIEAEAQAVKADVQAQAAEPAAQPAVHPEAVTQAEPVTRVEPAAQLDEGLAKGHELADKAAESAADHVVHSVDAGAKAPAEAAGGGAPNPSSGHA